MRSYLLYSSSVHAFILALVLFASRNSFTRKSSEAYYVDFIGPSSVVTMEKAAAAEGRPEAPAAKTGLAAKAAKPAEKADDDDFSGGALPKPSIFSSGSKLFDEEKAAVSGSSGENGTPLTTDSANFPYPWYITQVREALWAAWTEKMPSGGSLRCTVRFTINRNGSIKGVSVEKSSGNRLFDSAAESSVQSGAPFAALPDDFYEDRLTVHVEFKAMD
ncbi:MAG: energy transducer TonB [Elusimicrobiales bacterium]|nr:energy transducer TonB [Elusimicrobiales bacterium]